MYLSNLLKPNHKFIVIFDEAEEERYGKFFMENWLQIRGPAFYPEEKKKFYLRKFPILGNNLYDWFIWTRFVDELKHIHPINGTRNYYNVLIPTFSEMLYYLSATKALQFICLLRNCEHVKRICLWVSTSYCSHPNARFLMASCQHWADLVIHMESSGTHLTMIQSPRNPGGGVTETVQRQRYKYEKHMKPFDLYLQLCKKNCDGQHHSPRKAAVRSTATGTGERMNELMSYGTLHQNTFEMQLKDDELVARNALKLPYERPSKVDVAEESKDQSKNSFTAQENNIEDGGEGRIDYIPDEDEQMEEDLDDDLYI